MATILSRSTHSSRRHQSGVPGCSRRSARYACCMRLGSRERRKSSRRISHPNRGVSGAISTRTRAAEPTTHSARQSQKKPSERLLRVGLLILDRWVHNAHGQKTHSHRKTCSRRIEADKGSISSSDGRMAWSRKVFPMLIVVAKWS